MNADEPTSSSAKKKEIVYVSGSISKRGMNFLVVIGKCGSFYIIYHEKAGKKIEIKCPAENNF